MCDSSVGGKTGVDTKLGKNLIGSIYNPELIVTNTAYLDSLDKRNFKNGLVEIIKMGVIADLDLFEALERTNIDKLIQNSELLYRIMRKSVENKAIIIQADLKEAKLRKILNFGHTIGHAIEAHENGRLLHGEAVAIGIRKELELAHYVGLTSKVYIDRVIKLLESNYELDTEFSAHLDLNSITGFLVKDKKNHGAQIH